MNSHRKNEIRGYVYTVHSPDSAKLVALLAELQRLIGGKLIALDDRDPIRTKWDSLEDAAAYALKFASSDTSRSVGCRFDNSTAHVGMRIVRPTQCVKTPFSTLSFTIDRAERTHATIQDCARALFQCACDAWGPFYGACDCNAGYARPAGVVGAVDMNSELPGMFWMTYFARQYVSKIGSDRLNGVGSAIDTKNGGKIVVLAENPFDLTMEERITAEGWVGDNLFEHIRHRKGALMRGDAIVLADLLANNEEC